MEGNIFEKVVEDAVAESRAGDPRLTSQAANFPSTLPGTGTTSITGSTAATWPNAAGASIEPFVVDETAVDSPTAYML